MLGKILSAKFLRMFNMVAVPYKINLFLTYCCNQRCRICFIWKKYIESPKLKDKELTKEEWGRFFQNLGSNLYWLSISGGEPFIRKDLIDIIESISSKNLSILGMNTNGILSEKILNDTQTILKILPQKTKFFITVSLNGFKKTHNFVAGINSYDRAENTYALLKTLQTKMSNFYVEREVTVSKYNLKELNAIIDSFNRKRIPFTLTFAQESEFYENIDKKVMLSQNDRIALANILRKIKIPMYKKQDLIKRMFKKLAIRSFENPGQPIPCYSSWASVRIDPYGNVYPCIILNDIIGNLKENDLDLKKTLMNSNIKAIQKRIKNNGCSCWTPCEAYQTILQNFPFI